MHLHIGPDDQMHVYKLITIEVANFESKSLWDGQLEDDYTISL